MNSEAEVEQLIEMLESPGRVLPMFIASGDERTEQSNAALIDIYYAWVPTSQQIVVADLPAHRRAGAT